MRSFSTRILPAQADVSTFPRPGQPGARRLMHDPGWSAALAAFRIHFGERLPDTAI
jgi:hypothetical protein